MPSGKKESIELPENQIDEPTKAVISEAPSPQSEMKLFSPTKEEQDNNNNDNDNSNSNSNTSNTPSSSSQVSDDEESVSEVGSGFQRDQNECTEFCIEFLSCFGLCETCCPSSGEGFLTTCATICGNVLVGCCKC